MTADRIDIAKAKLTEAHASLNRVNGMHGVVVTERKLELIIDAVALVIDEIEAARGNALFSPQPEPIGGHGSERLFADTSAREL